MFRFGVIPHLFHFSSTSPHRQVLIVEQFLDRIARWPQMCAALVAERGVGPQFKSCYPDYYE